MIDTELTEQRSVEWRMARVGFCTASKVYDVIARNKPKKGQEAGEYSAKRSNYFDTLVAERLTGKPQDWKEVRSLTERADLEPDARACYSFYTGNEVREAGFIKHPRIAFAGCSPDGLIGNAGGMEIKALDAARHRKLFGPTRDAVMLEYLPQVHFNMSCTGRLWWDFVGFNPNMPEALKLFVHRVPRDDEMIVMLDTAVIEFLAEIEAELAPLMALTI